jgi:hypothetical protein
MRLYMNQILFGLATLVLAIPVSGRTYKASWRVMNPIMIGSTQMKTGDYQLRADDSKADLMILQNGKVLVSVPGQWVKLSKKADFTAITNDGTKVTEIQFSGSDQAFQPR